MTENPYPFSREINNPPEWIFRRNIPEVVQTLATDRAILGQAYTRTIFRVEKETRALQVCRDMQMMDDVYYGFDGVVGGTQVTWNDQSAIGDGQYNLLEDKISTAMGMPTREEILVHLAAAGKFPFTVDMLAHELAHKRQFPPDQWKRMVSIMVQLPGVASKYFPGRELIEAMAYRITTVEPHEGTPLVLTEHLMEATSRDGSTAYAGFDRSKVTAAIAGVDNLLALGINTLDLCKLAYEPGAWDEETKTFPQLNREIVKLMLALHVKFDDLPRLRSEYILRRLVDTKKSQEIAQTEIIAAASDLEQKNTLHRQQATSA